MPAKKAESDLEDAVEELRARLHEIDEKLNYLVKNLRRVNGRHDSFNSNLNEFMDEP